MESIQPGAGTVARGRVDRSDAVVLADAGDVDPAVAGDDPSARSAAIVFAALVVAAAPLLLWLGNRRWFSSDEWGFLVSYSLDDVSGLFVPQNGHWSTIPVVAFQGLYEVVGLRSYWAYQVLSVSTHLLAVVVVRVVMRRAGVRPWVATLAAVSLLLFGSGQQNIFVAIQITFVGAFVLGVSQVLLADHDGRVGWRDGLGVVAGIAALMCSAVGVAMIPVVAIAVLVRRGWRVSALHVLPVVAVFGWWFVRQQPRTTAGVTDHGMLTSLGNILRWDIIGLAATFRDLAWSPMLAAVVAAGLVGGLVLAWQGRSWAWWRRSQGAPVALLVGGIAFLTLTGYSRWMLADSDGVGTQSRYQYMVAAFAIPALGVAADAIARRWRVAVPVLAALYVIGLVGNVRELREPSAHVGPQWDHHRDVILGSTRSPLATEVSPFLRPDPIGSFFVSIGWLLEADRLGRLPDPAPIDPNTEAELPVRLGLRQGIFGSDPPACTEHESLTVTPTRGQVYSIEAPAGAAIGVRTVDDAGQPTSPVVVFAGSQGRIFTAELPGQRLEIAATVPGAMLTICS